MIKQIGLMSRRAGMTREAFRRYYESHHRVIGEKYLRGFASHYVRRYPAVDADVDFDVILEVWYPDQATLEEAKAYRATDAALAEIIADEERLFDRSRHRFFEVDECVSDLTSAD